MGIFDEDIFGADHRESANNAVGWQRFQDAAYRDLTQEFSPTTYRFDVGVQRRTDAGDEYCPDFVVRDNETTSGAQPIVFVADAKDRAVLSQGEAEKVAQYGERLRPTDGPPRIYVPAHCVVQAGARAIHDAGRVEIARLDDDD